MTVLQHFTCAAHVSQARCPHSPVTSLAANTTKLFFNNATHPTTGMPRPSYPQSMPYYARWRCPNPEQVGSSIPQTAPKPSTDDPSSGRERRDFACFRRAEFVYWGFRARRLPGSFCSAFVFVFGFGLSGQKALWPERPALVELTGCGSLQSVSGIQYQSVSQWASSLLLKKLTE